MKKVLTPILVNFFGLWAFINSYLLFKSAAYANLCFLFVLFFVGTVVFDVYYLGKYIAKKRACISIEELGKQYKAEIESRSGNKNLSWGVIFIERLDYHRPLQGQSGRYTLKFIQGNEDIRTANWDLVSSGVPEEEISGWLSTCIKSFKVNEHKENA